MCGNPRLALTIFAIAGVMLVGDAKHASTMDEPSEPAMPLPALDETLSGYLEQLNSDENDVCRERMQAMKGIRDYHHELVKKLLTIAEPEKKVHPTNAYFV